MKPQSRGAVGSGPPRESGGFERQAPATQDDPWVISQEADRVLDQREYERWWEGTWANSGLGGRSARPEGWGTVEGGCWAART